MDRGSALVPFVAAVAAMLLVLGAATLTGMSTAHRSMMDHVAAETGGNGALEGDHEYAHPGMGIHLAGACSAVLAAAFVLVAMRRRSDALTEPAEHPNVGPTVRPIAKHLWAAARGEPPPRLALCVELR